MDHSPLSRAALAAALLTLLLAACGGKPSPREKDRPPLSAHRASTPESPGSTEGQENPLPPGDTAATPTDTLPPGVRSGLQLVERFCKTYLENQLRWEPLNEPLFQDILRREDSLLQANFTPWLRNAKERWEKDKASDFIFHTQEMDAIDPHSLKVMHVGGNWYQMRVKHSWIPPEDEITAYTYLHLTTPKKDETARIDYISLTWEPDCHGDSLFFSELPRIRISQASPEEFLRTFYEAYAAGYCSLQFEPEAYADSLRALYLTPRAQAQFRQAEAAEEYDSRTGYDLLLTGFCFERCDIPHIRIVPAERGTYKIHFRLHSSSIRLKLAATEEGYRIDSIGTFNPHVYRNR